MEQSRRDDLESVGYVLMYFLRGGLPWQGLKIKSKEDRYKKILDKKKETTSEQLCKGFPEEFKDFLEYAKNLEYTEEPKYEKYKNKFYNLVTNKMEENFDYIYDWTTPNDIKKRKVEERNGTDLKTTDTRGVDLKNKGKSKEEIFESNNSFNKANKIEEQIKKDDENFVNDKADSRCCIM